MRRQWLKGLLGVFMLGALASAGPAAEMKKVVILDFPQDALRQKLVEQTIKGLEQGGFVDQQNIEIHMVHPKSAEEEIIQIQALNPAVVIGMSPRLQQTMSLIDGQPTPFITIYGIEDYVDAQGLPKKMITGMYSVLPDMVYHSFKFFNKVAPLQSGKKVVFLWNSISNLIRQEYVEDACRRLNIPLKAIVDATVVEDWQAAIAQYNNDPEIGWFILASSPFVKRDGSAVDVIKDIYTWQQEHQRKPTLAYFETVVKGGALCGFAIDLDDRSHQAGEMAVRVLKGEDVKTINAEYPRKTLVALNRKTADTLGIIFSLDVLNLANVIYHDWEGKNVSRKSGLK